MLFRSTPEKLGHWLQSRLEHPERIAAQYAQKAIDPKLAALEKKLAEAEERLQRFAEERDNERALSQAYSRGESMLNFVTASANDAPYSARFIELHGPEEFLKLANSAYAGDRPGWEQHTLDVIEENLSKLGQIFTPKIGRAHV